MSTIENSPVKGYTDQSKDRVELVNKFKILEERLLREIDQLAEVQPAGPFDMRWTAVARTHFQEGFMALNRSVFQPQRIALPEDRPAAE